MKKFFVICADTKDGDWVRTLNFDNYKSAETAAKRQAVTHRQDVYVLSTITKALMPMPEVEIVKADVEVENTKKAA